MVSDGCVTNDMSGLSVWTGVLSTAAPTFISANDTALGWIADVSLALPADFLRDWVAHGRGALQRAVCGVLFCVDG